MLVLALDTASPTTSVAVLRVSAASGDAAADAPVDSAVLSGFHREFEVGAEVDIADSRRPAEHLAPAIEQALAQAGVRMPDIELIGVGAGPGPFTGLRAGLVTARVLGRVLSVPVVGVVSLDALAFAAPRRLSGDFLVATDARRREVYWARYTAGRRVQGPAVSAPGDVDTAGLPVIGRGAMLYPGSLGAPAADALDPPAWAIGVLAARSHARGEGLPADPLYLRRPDVTEPAPRKRVLAG